MKEKMASEEIPPQQYYISRRVPDSVPDGFAHIEIRPWHLILDSEFSVIPIVEDDEQRGVVFGTVLDPETKANRGAIQLRGHTSTHTRKDLFEYTLDHLLGRFVGVLRANNGVFLYTDPIGALPCVYDEEQKIAAASPSAMPKMNHSRRFRTQLLNDIRRPFVSRGENIWIPGTITYYRGIKRLLPNHRLNLNTWEISRYWPSEQQEYSSMSKGIDDIIGLLHQVFNTIEDRYENPKLSLTAGKDSRSLLAAGRSWATDGTIPLFTIGNSDRDVDVHIARRLTSAHDLSWTPLPIIEADETAQSRWSWRTGYTIGSAVKETYTTMHNLNADVELGGIGGEIGRSYLWKESDEADTEIGPVDVLSRYHKPEHPELVATLEEWFRGVEQFDTYTKLDLAHQEHRLGCWGGPQHLGFRPHVDHVRPFSYRPIIESMHSLPPDIRRKDQLPLQIIEQCWPELSDFPYNSFTGWKRYWMAIEGNIDKMRAAISNPGVAIEYLSQKYGDPRKTTWSIR